MGRANEYQCVPPGRRERAVGNGSDGKERPAAWIAYGKLVRLFRERAALTQQGLADAIGYSVEQVASVEQGRRPAKAAFTEAAERVLEAGGALRVLQEDVDRAKLPEFFQDFASIEVEAISRFSYDPLLIPGLLQTEAYARALFTAHCPALENEVIDLHTEARLSRQQLLTRSPLVELSFVIGEAALTNPVGGPEVMREQLLHLVAQATLRNASIQIMPAVYGFHPGLNGGFVVLETAEHRRFAYVESQEVGSVVSDPARVSAFDLRYGKLRSQALNPADSSHLLGRLAGEKSQHER
ncbi:Helix-turn-helix domain-containing protein [Streptomyces sp. 2131.1]|uniref:helix-turn-helix domain-containing protein n=1 Tax=Streptomyces sp. 2131.1 TaxID=1855346 RepID=UPI0008972D2B|nr:helix-turn-helix transcriptional regulator [Streptomyces sp. 2131.1]SEC01858.1 Helix-turn-helix domain-containing protein [Streptomyces sp. 2131.1]